MVTAAKTTSQVLVHMSVAFATMYVLTGSLAFGGAAAILEPICNVLVMPLHERLWERIRRHLEQRRRQAREQTANAQPA